VIDATREGLGSPKNGQRNHGETPGWSTAKTLGSACEPRQRGNGCHNGHATVESWAEHLRQHHRASHADADLQSEAVRSRPLRRLPPLRRLSSKVGAAFETGRWWHVFVGWATLGCGAAGRD